MAYKFNFLKKDAKYSGISDETVTFFVEKALCETSAWRKFVNQFREQRDG